MRTSRLALFFALLVSPAVVPAQPACPWLTVGTAAELLGQPVTMTVAAASPSAGTCEFATPLGGPAGAVVLQIAVASPATATCPAGSERLAGIGQDALACRIAASPQQSSAVVSSRVRALPFSVKLVVRDPAPAALPPEAQAKIVRQVAESVAGSLF